MALPKLASAKYELTLPSTGERIEFRPFLVKEEKALMLAQQSGKDSDIMRALKDVINACTFDKVKAETLPTFDLEYMFINLRAKSVGEVVDLNITCPDDGTTTVAVKVDLMQIQCVKEIGHDNNIKITDDIGMIMDYPKVDSIKSLSGDDEVEAMFDVVKACIRQIYDSENVYEKTDMEKSELDEFVESMSHEQFEKVQEFFNTMPKVKHPIKVKNPNTGVESEVVLEGMQDFF